MEIQVNNETYVIADDLAGMHRDLTPQEFKQLQTNILDDGRVKDPIAIWEHHAQKFVLDGRSRLMIVHEHPHITFDSIMITLPDREAAQRWVSLNQLGRRNLSDFEQQRLRAEQAKRDGTKETAEAHGVSRRTVQRDMEIEDAKEAMSEDIRKKVEKGAIIASKRDLKEFGELGEHQRAAVEKTLRDNPSLTLTQALPKEGAKLTADDYAVINENPHLTAQLRQSLSLGTIFSDSESVQKFAALEPDQQVTVVALLQDPDCDSLVDALITLRAGKRPIPVDDGKKVEGVLRKLHKSLQDAMRLLDDLKALRNDKSGHKACIASVKDAIAKVEAWR